MIVAKMPNGLKDIIEQLQRQREAIDHALAALQAVDGGPVVRGTAKRRGRPRKIASKRVLSAEARERIAAAQRKRWAAARKKSAKK